MKIIFVASDFSGLGKGTLAASLGRLFKSHGIDVRIMKCDLYYNYDAGTINPKEHGEVYVLSDGLETDQDLGIYERYLDITCNRNDYVTSGQVHHQIYLNERSGKYLGQTVSFEHVIDEIKRRIIVFSEQCQIGIVEIGATIGDIKGAFFLEACRQIRADLGQGNTLFALLSHFPYLKSCGELKTMGCQRSVNELRGKGLKPDVIIARTPPEAQLTDYLLKKIEVFCEVPRQAVVPVPDIDEPYELPKLLRELELHKYISSHLEMSLGEDKLDSWYGKFEEKKDIRVALVGKYPHSDAYVSIVHQLRFQGVYSVTYLPTAEGLADFDAVVIPGGWGKRGVEEMIEAAKICRENQIPCLGICLGLQIMAIEYARNVLEISEANSIEFDENTEFPVVLMQEAQKSDHGLGGTARLGDWTTQLTSGSLAAKIFGSLKITQRHRHRYEINSDVDFGSFLISGRDERTGLIEVMELPNHPFYIGVQFHPEFSAKKNPLFGALVEAAQSINQSRLYHTKNLKELLCSGTPGTFFESIDIRDIDSLRAITSLSADQLQIEKISLEQQRIVKDFLEIWNQKKDVMIQVEEQIESYEREMREINLKESYVNEEVPLTDDDKHRLESLRHKIDMKTSELKGLRYFYQEQMQNYDDRMRKTFGEINVGWKA